METSVYYIGDRVRERRRQMRLTQKELAQRIGTSYKYISRLENGSKFPSLEMLICIARELQISLDYLIRTDESEDSFQEDEIRHVITSCSANERTFLIDVMLHIKESMKQLNTKG